MKQEDDMTREEMIERAVQMRSRDLYGKISEEELAQLRAVQKEIQIPISGGRNVHVYEITAEDRRGQSAMLINFHGGGFIKGRQGKDQWFCSKLAEKFGVLVWDVDYSLAPEYPFPTAVHEAYNVVEYAFAHARELEIDPSRVILMGHSAGGNLAVTVCMRTGETKAFQPAGLIAEFFPTDLYTDPAKKTRIEGDMPAEVARTYNAFYCEGETAKDPYASPAFAKEEQLKAFPDTLIMTGGRDSLCFEGEEFAKRLSEAGVTVTSRRFVNSLHGFTINRSDEWKDSMKLTESFIATHITKPE
jgi:acetyl esterase